MAAFMLGCFAVAPDGTLLCSPDDPASIRFAWRGRPCRAEVAPARLRLEVMAGRVPSTAEPGADRMRALGAVRALPRSLPRDWRVSLTPDHSIRIETTAAMPNPPTAVSLVAAMIRFALALDPYLDALEAGGSGSWKTCPG